MVKTVRVWDAILRHPRSKSGKRTASSTSGVRYLERGELKVITQFLPLSHVVVSIAFDAPDDHNSYFRLNLRRKTSANASPDGQHYEPG